VRREAVERDERLRTSGPHSLRSSEQPRRKARLLRSQPAVVDAGAVVEVVGAVVDPVVVGDVVEPVVVF
jgi:hypothetical protein